MNEQKGLQKKIAEAGQWQSRCWNICAMVLILSFLRRNDTVAKDALHALYAELFRAFPPFCFLAAIVFLQWQKTRYRKLLQTIGNNGVIQEASHRIEN